MASIDTTLEKVSDLDIAIVGMSGRFPGANSVDAFWENLRDKIESISFFSEQDLVDSGIERSVLENSEYVKASPILEDIESFDASFFGFSPKEAEFMDPQNRLFLECAWEVLEKAGYDPETYEGLIGVYGGVSTNTYFLSNVYKKFDLTNVSNVFAINKDFLSTSVSYKLNLKGPSVSVQTYCSTALVATHLACKSLLDEECDMALAGGVTIQVPHKSGYLYQEDGILSPDGHCRAFDAKAQGTVFGNGLGIVLLKRLKDAIGDRDCIHAVIKGSAINNDGSLKVSYAAPSVDGQAEVIVEALANAGISAEDISYIEAHGTGTAAGDPVEIAALTKAFHTFTKKSRFCPIGSVKTNIGHLDAAAGMASLIKTVLALKHQQIPPSLHFETPNPQIDFKNSPFYVNTELTEWEANSIPRRAGVSSLGFGGTNAHIVLEEAPEIRHFEESRPWQLLLLSAKTGSALETATANLTAYLKQNLDINLADVAYTLQVGRRAFNYRRALVCQSREDGLCVLEKRDQKRIFTVHQEHRGQPVIFMFSGQGAQYVDMAHQLYEVESTFKQQVDTCAQILRPQLNLDIRQILFPQEHQIETASQQLQQTAITQPALFVIEYALAQLWQEWGVCPEAMIGHSIGEYVAATVAGVFSLEDALTVVATRAKLMQQLPTGSMLAIPLSEEQVQSWLEQCGAKGISCQLAAVNSPSACVVSGSQAAIASLQHQLSVQGIACRLLQTSHAFHSEMMDPILEPFVEVLQKVKLNPPRLRFISNVTGDWITDEQATSPGYWGQHLRQVVRFSAGISQLLEQFEGVFLEVGPGRTLSTLTAQHLQPQAKQEVLSSLHHPKEPQSAVRFLLQTLGRLWLAGVQIDWSGFYAHEQRHRVPLPTYPFERQRYWIESSKGGAGNRETPVLLKKKSDIADWFYVPVWKQSAPLILSKSATFNSPKSCTLVFMDECGLGAHLIEALRAQSQQVITVKVGAEFTQLSEERYALNPGHSDDYDTLFQELLTQRKLPVPERIVHLWNVTAVSETKSGLPEVAKVQERGFYSLLFLAQAIGRQNLSEELQLTVVSNNLQSVTGEERLSPEKATLLGPVKVISQEYPHISCRSIDVVLPTPGSWRQEKLTNQLLVELELPISERVIAYRGHNRWLQGFEPVRLEASVKETPRLREGGVYLITGGLGGIGLVLAKHLAESIKARLILTGRSAFPAREEWNQWLATHEETDSISYKIRKVQDLEALGAEVLVVRADVADLAQMREAIAQAQQQFGQLHGVIHAAGVPGGGVVQRKTAEEVQRILTPKVNGTLVLETLLKNVELDFFILCSSISSLMGGFGQVDYCGANAFLDAFANCKITENNRFITSINWGAWQEVGMAVNTVVPQRLQELRAEDVQQGIAPEEGADALRRILGTTVSQIITFPSDFNHFLKQNSAYDEASFLKTLESINKSDSKYPRPELSTDYVAPRNQTEQTLTDIWQQVLGVEPVGIHDNFFELGGDSLIGVQVISQIRKNFQLDLPISHLFEFPCIADLVLAIEEKLVGKVDELPEEARKLVLSVPKLSSRDHVPLSFAQQRLWFLEQLSPGSFNYNEPIDLRFVGNLSIGVLKQSIDEIVRRHEALRTTFHVIDGQPVQIIAPFLSLKLPVIDLRQLPKVAREAEVQRLAQEEAQLPFDLRQGPLLRVTLLQIDENENAVLVTTHHIVWDGWSIGILMSELATLYQAFYAGQSLPLPDLPIQYADFAVWQRNWLQGEVLEEKLNYWKQQIGNNLPVLQLPTVCPRSEVKTNRGATQSFVIPSSLSQAVKLLSRQEGVSLFTTLLAVFQVLLQRYTNQDDIVVGTDAANRSRVEIEPLIGFFMNLLVLRTDMSGNPSFRELLKRVREVVLGAYDHQDLPFEKLVEALQPKRSGNQTPLFQVLFVLQNTSMPVLKLPEVTLSNSFFRNDTARFDLTIFLTETDRGIEVKWRYNVDLFESITIKRMSAHFEALLESVITQPDLRINSLEMQTDSEKEQQSEDKRQRRASKLKKLVTVQTKAVKLSQDRLIKTDYLQPGTTLPFVIKPNVDDLNILEWARSSRDFIEAKLLHNGAILFRDFRIDSAADFEGFAEAICPGLFGEYGDLPREGVSGRVYGSTPYPQEQAILFHNESSHMYCWPNKIWFFCVQPAQTGGETPIVDCRKVCKLLSPKLRERFERKQLMYVRNYTDSLDVSWQDFFHTTNKTVVEDYCRQAKMGFEWSGNRLRTYKVRPAVTDHSKTGEQVFFNQLQLHHISCLEPAVRESLLSIFGEENLPRNVYYGDGSPIEDSVMAEVESVYQEARTSFPWQKGDILMLDNMLIAHGRNPYVGPRKIVVAMGEMCSENA